MVNIFITKLNFINLFLNNSLTVKFPKLKLHFVLPITRNTNAITCYIRKRTKKQWTRFELKAWILFISLYLSIQWSIIWYPFFGLPLYFHQLLYFSFMSWFNEVSVTVISFLLQPRGSWECNYYHSQTLSGFRFLHLFSLVLWNEIVITNKINKWQIILPFNVN